jgi:hypothetical protein
MILAAFLSSSLFASNVCEREKNEIDTILKEFSVNSFKEICKGVGNFKPQCKKEFTTRFENFINQTNPYRNCRDVIEHEKTIRDMDNATKCALAARPEEEKAEHEKHDWESKSALTNDGRDKDTIVDFNQKYKKNNEETK